MPDKPKVELLYEDAQRVPKPSEFPNQWLGDTIVPKTPEKKAESFVYELVKKFGTLNRNAQAQMEKSRKNQ